MIWRKILSRGGLVIILATFLLFSIVYFCFYGSANIPFGIKQEIKSKIRWVQDLPYFFYKNKSENDGIPAYGLYIEEKDLKQLNDNLPEYGKPLTDEYKEYQPAKFTIDGREYDVQVKYRGTQEAHWLFPKKSWRIKFSEDDLYNGIRAMSLILPDDRGFVVEALNDYRAKKLNLVSPYLGFALLKINNEKQGIYLQYEHWGKEFLEKNKLSGDSNLYGEKFFDPSQISYVSIYEQVSLWKKYNRDIINKIDNYAEINQLVELVTDSSDEEFFIKIPDILDMENFYNWQVHSILARSRHQCDGGNARLYFNNAIGKFQIIPWDVGINMNIVGIEDYRTGAGFVGNATDNNILIERILKNPEFLAERDSALRSYVENSSNLEDDLNYYDKIYEQIKWAMYNDRIKNHTNKFFDNEVEKIRGMVTTYFNHAKEYLSNS